MTEQRYEWFESRRRSFRIRVWSSVKKKMLPQGDYRVKVLPNGLLVASSYLSKMDELIILQSTGCFDMDNSEVYEGDVVRTDELGWTGCVCYGGGGFYLEDKENGFSACNYLNWKGCKVLGNIFENPELMEEL